MHLVGFIVRNRDHKPDLPTDSRDNKLLNAVQVADGHYLVIFNTVSSTEVACHQRKVERFP